MVLWWFCVYLRIYRKLTSTSDLRDLSFMIFMLICVAVAVAGVVVVIDRIVFLNTNLNTKQ